MSAHDEMLAVERAADRIIRLAGWRTFELGVMLDDDGEWVLGILLEHSPEPGGLEVEVRGRSDDHVLVALRARLHAIGRPGD